MMTGNEIRARFLKYFEEKGHALVASSSLVPHNDPTLLFTNAGMNQFKELFLGQEKRDYVRAASAQKCVRAGGKHNDLENVGRTARHHTFFEMLGNFSFGDYFKQDAIAFGWEFLTREMGLPVEKLWVSVYRDDDEAFAIWRDRMGVREERILRLGEKDNFWAMGDTGPCGPCSEVHIDQGEDMRCGDDCALGVCDCDRFLELWNLVFMQYDRSSDGVLTPLPKPSIDTGMGLERITAVVQGVRSNYDSDLLRGIIAYVEELSNLCYGDDPEKDVSMRVIADHSRATAFLIADGVLPSNEGRGYVLRRIMRRAARHAKMLGFEGPVLYRTSQKVMEMMSGAYPELSSRAGFVTKVIRNEEERFIQTLDNGLRILREELERLEKAGQKRLPGELVFKLYDTFGFPVDLTADIVEPSGFKLDEAGFEACMEEQRRKAREHWKGSGEEAISPVYRELLEKGLRTRFTGYERLDDRSRVIALLKDGQAASVARQGEVIEIITEITSFYGESGGQAGDSGEILGKNGRARVLDTQKPLPDLIVHRARILEGSIALEDEVELRVEDPVRRATALNHTATHILQAVLVKQLGDHVKQAGSLVGPERLRFDFTHFSPMTAEEIAAVEDEVNRRIRENAPVRACEMAQEEALKAGATALFGEKYGNTVRVVNVGEFSMELCGGTHTRAAGDIGLFKILQETGIAAGVRRIEAATGERALALVRRQEQLIARIASQLKTDKSMLENRVQKLLERQKELERELETLQARLNAGASTELLSKAKDVKGVKVLATVLEGVEGAKLREFSDQLRDRLGSGILVLGVVSGDRVNLLVSVSKDLSSRIKAGDIIRPLAQQVGGSGGGKPELAQAGGTRPEQLPQAIEAAPRLVETLL